MIDQRVAMIEKLLHEALQPQSLEISDQSSQHAGHTGAAGGGGHYDLTIVSAHFNGLSQIARHRLIYEALGVAMGSEIHALAITAFAPDEI